MSRTGVEIQRRFFFAHLGSSATDITTRSSDHARQRLGLRQPSAALGVGRSSKAAEGCRSPKPRGFSVETFSGDSA